MSESCAVLLPELSLIPTIGCGQASLNRLTDSIDSATPDPLEI